MGITCEDLEEMAEKRAAATLPLFPCYTQPSFGLMRQECDKSLQVSMWRGNKGWDYTFHLWAVQQASSIQKRQDFMSICRTTGVISPAMIFGSGLTASWINNNIPISTIFTQLIDTLLIPILSYLHCCILISGVTWMTLLHPFLPNSKTFWSCASFSCTPQLG